MTSTYSSEEIKDCGGDKSAGAGAGAGVGARGTGSTPTAIAKAHRLRAAFITTAIAKITGYLVQVTVNIMGDGNTTAASAIAKATERTNGTPSSLPFNNQQQQQHHRRHQRD